MILSCDVPEHHFSVIIQVNLKIESDIAFPLVWHCFVTGIQVSRMSLSGQVAVVTGAARGIGKGYAEALLQRKAKVSLPKFIKLFFPATIRL